MQISHKRSALCRNYLNETCREFLREQFYLYVKITSDFLSSSNLQKWKTLTEILAIIYDIWKTIYFTQNLLKTFW